MVYIRTVEWSPGGSKILFIENRELAKHDCFSPTTDGVYVVGRDGSGLVGLGISEPAVYSYEAAAWSPDGSRIAVLADVDPKHRAIYGCDNTQAAMDGYPRGLILFTMAPDGSDVRLLAEVSQDG